MTTAAERFWAKVNKTDDHWLWTGAVSHGYGNFWDGARYVRAHRFSKLATEDEIPSTVVDHLCRTKLCVRPSHLEQVPQRVNNERAGERDKKDRCKNGHEFTDENTRRLKTGYRVCVTCVNEKHREGRARRRRQLQTQP